MKPRNIIIPLLLCASTAAHSQENFKPRVYGVVKTRFEIDTQNGKYRFSVRNSRLGVKGYAARNMSYALQIELNSEGKLSVLDSYAAYEVGAFTFSLGQQMYHFSTEVDRGAADNLFANRSMISKYLTSYHGTSLSDGVPVHTVKALGSRDMGLLGTVRLLRDSKWPVKWHAGIFNGSGINNFRWNNHLNFVTRLQLGRDKSGLNLAASYYNGHTPINSTVLTEETPAGTACTVADYEQRMQMWDFEASYHGRRFRIESEVAQKWLSDDGDQTLTAAYVQGFYRFPLPENRFARTISPLLRWDMGDNVDFLNTSTGEHDRFDAHRLTAGLTIGISETILKSEIRFNYEQYFLGRKPSDYGTNNLLHNRFTIEFIAAF